MPMDDCWAVPRVDDWAVQMAVPRVVCWAVQMALLRVELTYAALNL